MEPHYHHGEIETVGDARLVWSVALNLLLTVVQVVGGAIAGSLSLMADALHNLNDCAALLIALVARRIGRRQADHSFTFGYRRAELIGAMINLTTLVLVGLYLVYEAIVRFIHPEEIRGGIVVTLAAVALAVDLGTAALLWTMSGKGLNLRAAFVHNLSDALASAAVMLGGVAILLWRAWWVDPLLTILISAYILWLSFRMLERTVLLLMEAAPEDHDPERLIDRIRSVDGVCDLHHLHVWQMDEGHPALEAHIVVAPADADSEPDSAAVMERIKAEIKRRLASEFDIGHSSLEFEFRAPNGHVACPDTSMIPKH
ncbi:cation transporter [Candidatus Sumerlaeota bacterium]|nr:cation transporter [Candidatus Sumerlaeota bacterium]